VVDLHVQLDDTVGAKLRERAARLGVQPEALVEQAVAALLASDPFEFVGLGESDHLRGDAVDDLLAEHGFGRS
jgi:hypothetical protein